MSLLIYTFTFNTETKQATKTGNISTRQALHLLLDILNAELEKEIQDREAGNPKLETQNSKPEVKECN